MALFFALDFGNVVIVIVIVGIIPHPSKIFRAIIVIVSSSFSSSCRHVVMSSCRHVIVRPPPLPPSPAAARGGSVATGTSVCWSVVQKPRRYLARYLASP